MLIKVIIITAIVFAKNGESLHLHDPVVRISLQQRSPHGVQYEVSVKKFIHFFLLF